MTARVQPRYIALFIPNWELSSLVVEAPPEASAAVISRSRIQVVTPQAACRGVRVGMSQTMAQYLCPDLLIFGPDKEREAAAFEVILQVFDDFAADVVAIRPGLACAPARGPAKWAGGEEPLMIELAEQVAMQTGAECQIGIADTLTGALLAAREGRIIPSMHTGDFLDSQQLAVLISDLPPHLKKTIQQDLPVLASLGVTNVRQLRSLGVEALVTRFGKSGSLLWRLAFGPGVELSTPPRSEGEVRQEIELEEPAFCADEVVVAIRQVSNALADSLVHRGLYSSTIRICLERANGETIERTWTLVDASSSSQVGKRIAWQVSGLSQGMVSGGSDSFELGLQTIRVAALHAHRVPETDPLWGGGQNLRKVSKAVEEVQSLLGEDAALTPTIHGGFDPRSRVSLLSWGASTPLLPPRQGPWEGGVGNAPIVLFSKAPDALMMGIKADGTHGRVWVNRRGELTGTPRHLMVYQDHPELPSGDHLITEVKGIWVVGGRWWHPEQSDHQPRCYLRVVREGGADLLLVQKGRGCWVEGIYQTEEVPWLNSTREDKWRNSTSATGR